MLIGEMYYITGSASGVVPLCHLLHRIWHWNRHPVHRSSQVPVIADVARDPRTSS